MLTDEGLHPLLQSSKKGVFPHHYIALFGDSYAAGMGDWSASEMSKPNARYSTAHLLQDATGKDVVSFGSAGAGSVRGIVTEPISQLAYLKQYIRRDIESPEWILVYFYEGNDLYDNAAYFHYSFPRLFDVNQQFNAEIYRQYLQKFAIDRDKTVRMTQANDWLRHWPFLNFLNAITRVVLGIPPRTIDIHDSNYDPSLDPPWIFGGASIRNPGKINQAEINGKVIQLPDALQGAAMALNEEEWKQAWFALEQSLSFMRQEFPSARVAVVYIPSVLSVYDLKSEQVSVQTYERRATVFARQQQIDTAQKMRKTLAKIAADQHLPFVDTTDDMRTASKTKVLHGPTDWNHPNKNGYTVIAESIVHQLKPRLDSTVETH